MNSDSAYSVTSSATTPLANPLRRPKPRTELEFLQQQAEDARVGAAQTLHEIGAGLGRSVDVRAWTGEHPWAAMSTAAVAGFATVALVMPSKQRRALRRLAEIERALQTPEPAKEFEPQTDHAGQPIPPKPSFGTMIMRELAKTLIGLAFGAAATAVGRFTESHNGAATESDKATHS
jgi:hypothetical protein